MSADWTLSGDGRAPARMDFISETEIVDEDARIVRFAMRPDPRRYDEVEIDGSPHYLDKFLRHIVARDEMFGSMQRQMDGLPVFASPVSIESAEDYSIDRKSALVDELQDGDQYAAPSAKTKPQTQLEAGNRRAISFLSVDIEDSTKLRRADPAGFDRAFDIFFRELGTVVGAFYGDILKTTGDGFIAMVDYPAFTTQCDATVDLALTMLRVLQTAVNPALASAGLPPLAIRIGAEIGPATIKQLAIAATGYSAVDIASDALNRCAKIEKSASRNELRIGEVLHDLLHVQWLLRCEQVDDFDPVAIGEDRYRVYRVR